MEKHLSAFVAAEVGFKDVLLKLITAKTVDTKGPFGRTCLIVASMANQPQIVEILLKMGANLQLRCQQGLTAFDWATRLQQIQSAELLKAYGAVQSEDINIKMDDSLKCVELGTLEDIKGVLLADQQAIIRRSAHKRSLLHVSAILGRCEHWEFLASKLDPNQRDEIGLTPLNYVQMNPANHLFAKLNLPYKTYQELSIKVFDPQQSHFDVVIVGAGAAGLAAARYLHEHSDRSYVILEARNRPCGRVYGEKVGGVDQDFGASWIHNYSQDNPFRELVKRFNWPLEKGVNRAVEWFDADAKDCKFDSDMYYEAQTLYGSMVENGKYKARQSKQNQSVWDSIKESYGKWIEKGSDMERYVFYCMFWNEHYEAASIQELDVFYDRYEGGTGGDAVPLPSYYHLMRKLSEGINIRLEHVVESIDYQGQVVKIKLLGRPQITANKIILTLPLGVLKANRVKFVPALPESHREAIERLGFGLMNKIFLEYDKKFWKGQIRIINRVNGKIAWLYDKSTSDRFVLMCFTTADYARSLTKLSEDDIIKEADQILQKVYGEHCGKLLSGRATKWELEEFSLGSYSHFAVGSSEEDCLNLGKPVGGKVYFAGQHLHHEHIGTAYGAYITGLEAARLCLK